MRELDMRHTIRALAEYDRTQYARDLLIASAQSDAEVARWMDVELVAVASVREAFFLDTSDRNTWETCQCITIYHARMTVEQVIDRRAD